MKKIFSLFAAILFAGSMWATNVEFVAGTDQSSTTSITKGGVTISFTSGTFSRNDNYRCYANATMTISANVNITNIAFTFSSNSYTGGLSDSYQPNAKSWTSSAMSAQARITKIVVSIEDVTPAFTITAQSNNESLGTVSLTSSNVITGSPKAGCRYASPAYTVSPDGSATVSQEGNEFTVTPSANTTITINFEAIPTYTVSFSTGTGNPTVGDRTEEVGGEGITLPDAVTPKCTNWTFAGWAAAAVETEQTTAPTLLAAGANYKPTSNCTLFAVYKRIEGGADPEAYTVGDEGDFVLAAFDGDEEKWYALPANPTVNSGKISGEEITVSKTTGDVNYVAASAATDYTWTIAKSGDFYTLYDGKKYLYHSNGGNSGTNLATGTTADFLWDISSDANGLLFAGVDGGTVKTRGMLFNGSVFGGYALSNKDASGYYRVAVLPIAAATTYFISSPTCDPTAIDNTEASVKAVKFIENGQLFIEKNGHVYNVQGQLIK